MSEALVCFANEVHAEWPNDVVREMIKNGVIVPCAGTVSVRGVFSGVAECERHRTEKFGRSMVGGGER